MRRTAVFFCVLVAFLFLLFPAYARRPLPSREAVVKSRQIPGIIVGKVTGIKESGGERYAEIKIEKVIKGTFNSSNVTLSFSQLEREKVMDGRPRRALKHITYEKDKLYLLILSRFVDGSWGISDQLNYAITELKTVNDPEVSLAETMVAFNSITSADKRLALLKNALKVDWYELREYCHAKLSEVKVDWKELEPIFRAGLKSDEILIRLISASAILNRAGKDDAALSALVWNLMGAFGFGAVNRYEERVHLANAIETLHKFEPAMALAIHLTEAHELFSEKILSGDPQVLSLLLKLYECKTSTSYNPGPTKRVIREIGKAGNLAALPFLVSVMKNCPRRHRYGVFCECIPALDAINKLSGMDLGKPVSHPGYHIPDRVRKRVYAFWDITKTLLSSGYPPLTLTPELTKEIGDLIEKLGNDNWNVREDAKMRLIKIGPPVVEPLKKAAKETKDIEVRDKAQSIIEAVSVFPALELIEKIQKSAKEFEELNNLDIQVARLSNPDPGERLLALYYIGQHKDKKKFVDTLVNLVDDPSWFVRRACLKVVNSFAKTDLGDEQIKKLVPMLAKNLDPSETSIIQKGAKKQGITLKEIKVSTPSELSVSLLRKISGQGSGLDASKPLDERRKVIEEWQRWCESFGKPK